MSENEAITKADKSRSGTRKRSADISARAVENMPDEAVSEARSYIYIGPNIMADGLKQNTIYQSRPAELIEALTAKYKNISRLFVSVSKLSKAMIDMGRAGTPLYLAYNEMKEAR